MFVPKRATAPYQAIVYFPGASALRLRSSQQINLRLFEWVMRSGRALIHPIYKSTYERGDDVVSDFPNRRNTWREPEATSQLPMFNTLGTRPADKRRVVYDTGHNIPRPELIRESLEWLDKYLGPVR